VATETCGNPNPATNVFAFIYVLLFLLGVPGNTLLFLVLIQGLQRKSGNWVSRLTDPLFVSIVVLDLLFFLFNMPVMFANLIFKDWYLGHLLYIPNHCLSLWISFADFYTMLAISLLRYMAVIHPMSLILISQKHIAVACMFIWAICLLFTTPFWIHYGSVHMEGETYCVNQMAWKQMNLYLKLLGGVAFLFPTMLIIFCYSRIISTLRARRMLSVHTASSLHVNWHAIIIAFVTMVALVAMWLPYWLVIFFIKCNEFLTTVPTYLVYHLTSFLLTQSGLQGYFSPEGLHLSIFRIIQCDAPYLSTCNYLLSNS
uniref:G-protein coupled receptors family 1 profile domain-containing protein n=1 Tax=Salvator merianae TaxID=96440 RepID=A0A8D0KIK1_SALMN